MSKEKSQYSFENYFSKVQTYKLQYIHPSKFVNKSVSKDSEKKIKEEILSLVHIVGCQAQSNGYNSKNVEDIDLEWIEKVEKDLTNELFDVFVRFKDE